MAGHRPLLRYALLAGTIGLTLQPSHLAAHAGNRRERAAARYACVEWCNPKPHLDWRAGRNSARVR